MRKARLIVSKPETVRDKRATPRLGETIGRSILLRNWVVCRWAEPSLRRKDREIFHSDSHNQRA